MKVTKASVLCAICLLPLGAYAQSNAPLTRAQVREDVVALQIAGYNPSTSDPTAYPENVQAAQHRLDTMRTEGTYSTIAATAKLTGSGRTFYQNDDTQ
ncbi:DUF4148 domain-containing protein [Paraburkholderia sp. 2C]|jgi:uncharacterized protein DUF4148